MLLCARPHVKDVPFDTARFVVSTSRGLNVNGQHLEMGDEVPVGVLNNSALQRVYDRPLRLIETIDYARQIPGLVRECASRGTSLDISVIQEVSEVIDPVIEEATEMCAECGQMFVDLRKHSRKECKKFQKQSKQ